MFSLPHCAEEEEEEERQRQQKKPWDFNCGAFKVPGEEEGGDGKASTNQNRLAEEQRQQGNAEVDLIILIH